ncbi:protein SFI1 homolog, partial [Sceloporus undulatus]|uniref:protein SFI1 homolog n=1 Tax=Sceloporus undulatus TaxID=8520 RepID=UPI001C4CF3D7
VSSLGISILLRLNSHCRCHLERKTLHKAFAAWKEEWWSACCEWKLTIRADCHYRYFLYNAVLRHWRSYVFRRREKKTRIYCAEEHAAQLRTRWAWRRWRTHVELRQMKHQMHSDAFRFCERNVLRLTWGLWRRRWIQKRDGEKMAAQALQHWARRLQFHALLQWKEMFVCVWKDKMADKIALKHDRRRRLRKTLKIWRIYIQRRREKMLQKRLALEHCRNRVLLCSVSIWQLAWARNQELRRKRLGERFAARRFFAHWKLYVASRVEKAEHYKMAERHHRHRLLSCTVRALRKNAANASTKQIRKNLAHQQRRIMVLRSSWNRWKRRSEEEEEEADQLLTMAARARYSAVLFRRYFGKWQDRCNGERRQKFFLYNPKIKLQRTKADRHFGAVVLPVAFHAWKKYVENQRLCDGKKKMAADFHRETWTRRFFERWRQKGEERRQDKMAEETADSHSDWRLLSRFWDLWRRRTQDFQEEHEGICVAVEHHRRCVLRLSFCLWKENVEEVQERRMKDAKATMLRRAKLLSESWTKWRQYLTRRTEKWNKMAVAESHYQRCLLGWVFSAWMSYQSDVRRVLAQVDKMEADRCQESLREALRIWKESVMASKEEARKAALADWRYEETVLRKVTLSWRNCASLRAYARQQKADVVADAREHLNRARLMVVFLRWKECTTTSVQERGIVFENAQRRNTRLLQKCLDAWKQCRIQSLRKMLLQQQAERFLSQRILATSLSAWKKQMACRRRERCQTAQALWHWSRTLQAKAFDAWVGFVVERLRKRRRVEMAAESYRNDLLHEGVSRLLRYAADVKSVRERLQSQRHFEVASRRRSAATRCFTIWKQKVLFRKRGKPESAKKRVTFGATEAMGMAIPHELCPPPPQLHAARDAILTQLRSAQDARPKPRRPQFLDVRPASAPDHAQLAQYAQSDAVSGSWFNSFPPFFVFESSRLRSGSGVVSPNPELLPPSSFAQRRTETPKKAPSSPLPRLVIPPVFKMAAATSEYDKETGAKLQSADDSARRGHIPPLRKTPCNGVVVKDVKDPPICDGSHLVEKSLQCAASSILWKRPVNSLCLPLCLEDPVNCGGVHFVFSEADTEERGKRFCAEVDGQLEAELRSIAQKMQRYYDAQQELKSCRRQERLLRQWREMAALASVAKQDGNTQKVEETLAELRVRIESLKSVLDKERRLMAAYITRVREIRNALDA